MPDPFTDSNIALTPTPPAMPPSGPEGGMFPDQNAGQFSTGADFNANNPRTVTPTLPGVLNNGTSALQAGLSPRFEADVGRVAKMLTPQPPRELMEQANAADAERLRAEQKQKIAQAEGSDKAYSEFAGTARSALESYQSSMANAPLPAFVPTKETAGDLATLGSLLGVVGLMAGRGKGMQPALAAMDSMTGMLKGWQQGRRDLYEREYHQFRANFERTVAAHQEYARDLEKAFKVAETDLNKGLADANLAAVKAGDSVMQAAIKQGSLKRAMDLFAGQQQATVKATELVMNLEARQAARMGITPLEDGVLRSMVDQYLAGDKSALSGLGSGNVGAMNRAQFFRVMSQVMDERGITGADRAAKNAEFMGLAAALRSIGTADARTQLFVGNARKASSRVLSTSEAVDRGEYHFLNKLENSWATQSGDPKIIQFTAALNTFVQEYAKAVTPTGVPTDSMRAHAYEMLNTGMSKGQIRAALETLNQEMDIALESPADAFNMISSRISGRPVTRDNHDAPVSSAPQYKLDQIIERGGKKYKVVGGADTNDPDVEDVP